VGYLLASPLRRLFSNPIKTLSPYISSGMTVIDVGCAMGFFSLPLAEMVGSDGRIICIDLQEKMVQELYKRARKKNLHHRIEARVCSPERLNIDDLENTADFILASAVVHEVPDAEAFFNQLYTAAKNGGRLLVMEPAKHVSGQNFQATVDAAEKSGFTLLDRPRPRSWLTAVFQKNTEN